MMKHWSRDNGKTYYYGPENEFLEHCSRDPLCVECTERPSGIHEWINGEWVENAELKYVQDKYHAEQELRRTDRLMVIDSELDEKSMEEAKAYRQELRKLIRKEISEKPLVPKSIES